MVNIKAIATAVFLSFAVAACGTGIFSKETETACNLVEEYARSYVEIGEPSLEIIGAQVELCRKLTEADRDSWKSKWEEFAQIIEDALKGFLGGIVFIAAEDTRAVAAIERAAALQREMDLHR